MTNVKDLIYDSYGVRLEFILVVTIVPLFMGLGFLIYLNYSAEIDLVNSFDCKTFETWITQAENGNFITNRMYIERCLNS